MPILSNYHTHSKYCDGSGELEDFVLSALEHHMEYLGFSSHAPLPFKSSASMKQESFSEYKNEIIQLKEKYSKQIEIFLGLEIDFIPDVISPVSPSIQEMGLDYTIGSIHYWGPSGASLVWALDGPLSEFEEALSRAFKGDVKKAVKQYYQNLNIMVAYHAPDIIGHFDIIKKNNHFNRFFSEEEDWYREIVQASLDVISGANCVLEINTGGLVRKTSNTLYPSKWILKECLNRNIPIAISSDAHHPAEINGYFSEVGELLDALGFNSHMILTKKGWIERPLAL